MKTKNLLLVIMCFVAFNLVSIQTNAQVAPTCGAIILTGDDADDHGNQATYALLFDQIMANVTNGKTGILAIGVDAGSIASSWINTVSGLMAVPQTVTMVNDAAISTELLGEYAILFVPSDIFDTDGGISQSENDLLVARATDVAAAINAGGGLFGNTQGQLTNAYGYLGNVGAFTTLAVDPTGTLPSFNSFDDVTSTPAGNLLGITDVNLDHCCFHNVFTSYPSFLNVLAVANTPAVGDEAYNGMAVILGGAQVCVSTTCPLSHGYWKNHASAWPVSATPMLLGTVHSYSQAQLLTLFNSPVGVGKKADASIILAYQLIAAKLNFANGAVHPAVAATIAAADALIAGRALPITPKKAPSSTEGAQMVALASILEAYNTSVNPVCAPPVVARKANFVNQAQMKTQIHPNPANGATTIEYVKEANSQTLIQIHDMSGRKVADLKNEFETAGQQRVTWDSNSLPDGVYFYTITSGTQQEKGKILIKH